MTASKLTFEDTFIWDAYQPSADAKAVGGPHETMELIPGEPDTECVMYDIGGITLGAIKPIHDVLGGPPTVESVTKLKKAMDEWAPKWKKFRDRFPENASIGLDGQAVMMRSWR